MIQIKSNIPKIRFKEFSGEWEEKKLGEIFQINAGGDIDNNHVSKIKTDVFKYRIFANSDKNKGFYGYSDKYKIEGKIITVTGRGNLGVAISRNEKFYPIVRLLVLKPKNECDNYFFENAINNINFFIESTGVPQLTGPQISIYKTSFPKLPEQQKIASFLSSVDEKIENIKEKKKSLEVYKKGVMQKIFKQEIRFKGENGEVFGEWEEKEIGDLPIKISDGNYGELYPKSNDFHGFGIPFLRANNIKNLKIDDSDTKFIKIEQHLNLTSGHLKTNDILITTRGDLGNIALVNEKHNGSNINAQICLLRIIDKNLLNYMYLLYSLDYRDSKKQYIALGTGTALKQLPRGKLQKVKIKLPFLSEQEKIADFLSGIDEKIEKVGEELERVEEFKKGLLQGMFV